MPLPSGGRIRAVFAPLDALSPTAVPHHAFELLAIQRGAPLDAVRVSRRARTPMAV